MFDRCRRVTVTLLRHSRPRVTVTVTVTVTVGTDCRARAQRWSRRRRLRFVRRADLCRRTTAHHSRAAQGATSDAVAGVPVLPRRDRRAIGRGARGRDAEETANGSAGPARARSAPSSAVAVAVVTGPRRVLGTVLDMTPTEPDPTDPNAPDPNDPNPDDPNAPRPQ